jgi:hypothetical protein
MNSKYLGAVAGAAALFAMQGATPAFAIPEMQLDIKDGTYVDTTEDTVIQDDNFTVGAIYNSGSPSGTFYLSLALLTDAYGKVNALPGGASISVTYDGATQVINNWTFGTPIGGPELPPHDVFDTTYGYLTFSFDANDPRITNYDVQTAGGDWTTRSCAQDCSGTVKEFDVALTGLEGYAVHFDFFYITETGNGKLKTVKAPFSHDATGYACDPETDENGCDGPPPPPQGLPEPGTLMLLGAGLLGLGAARRRKA